MKLKFFPVRNAFEKMKLNQDSNGFKFFHVPDAMLLCKAHCCILPMGRNKHELNNWTNDQWLKKGQTNVELFACLGAPTNIYHYITMATWKCSSFRFVFASLYFSFALFIDNNSIGWIVINWMLSGLEDIKSSKIMAHRRFRYLLCICMYSSRIPNQIQFRLHWILDGK